MFRRLIQVHEQSSLLEDTDSIYPTKSARQSSEKTLTKAGGRTQYRINLNSHSRKSLWSALIDGGADGGIAGNDASKVAGTGIYIDLCGVDDHTVSNLELITAGAVVESQVGPIINIMNQYARMIDGKSIHSSGQMAHYKVTVNKKSYNVTGEVPFIELLDGHRIPLSTINGLTYMKQRPFTKDEWDTLPHMPITSDAPWDPKVLDYTPPIKWYKEQPQSLKLIEESIFDQHGEYKDSTTPGPTKEDQILDVETPTDDPNYKAPIETSKLDMRVYLHNLIKGETIPEYRIFFAGRQVLEVDIDHRVAFPTKRVHWDPSVKVRRSPRDHLAPIEHPVKPRVRKKTNILVPQDREAPVGVPIKTMDGNPLGQSNALP